MTGAQAAVLRRVDELVPTLLEDVSRFVSVPSVSGAAEEHVAQADMARRLRNGGLDVDHWAIDVAALSADPEFPGMEVERSEAWGVVGRLPGSGGGPTLMLNGHVDVVPVGDPDAWSTDPFGGSIVDDRIVGRGAADMKAGLLAAHWAVQAIRSAGVRLLGDVLVASVQGEEDGGLGTFALLRRGWSADACVVPEPTGLDVIPANAGALTFRLRVRGSATHAARREEGVSAIEKFWPVWRALVELEDRRHLDVAPTDRFRLAHPLSIGTVRAGDWASSVPDLLVAEGRLGVAIGEPVAAARKALEATVAEACAGDEWLRDHPVEVEWWGGQFASGRLPEGSDLVERVSSAHVAAGGAAPPQVYAAPYGSDLRLLTGLGGIPTVQYGPGDAAVAHGPDEYVPVDEVVTCARALALLALEICGVAP